MSLLDHIINKKKHLKNTDTVVTNYDGSKYLHTQGHEVKLETSFGFVVDTKPDNIPALIEEFLYLGSQDCCEESILLMNDIKYVLSVGIKPTTKADKLVYYFVECLDLPETNIRVILDKSISYIDNAIDNKSNILVHCNAGVSRSASMVIGYLILRRHMTFYDAFNKVKLSRPCVKPNIGFERQLKAL